MQRIAKPQSRSVTRRAVASFVGYLVLGTIVIVLDVPAHAQSSYELLPVARTGDQLAGYGPVIRLGREPSINNLGHSSFIARNDASSQTGSIFVSDGTSVTKSFDLTPLQVVGELVQINDSDHVTWQDRVLTNGDTFIRRFEDGLDDPVVAIGSTTFSTPFTFVLPWPSINNAGRVVTGADVPNPPGMDLTVLAGRNGGSGAHDISMAISGFPDFHPMLSDDDKTVVRGGGDATAPLVVFLDAAFSTSTSITVGSANGLVALGARPSISDDGDLVAFHGEFSGGSGPGLFGLALSAAPALFSIPTPGLVPLPDSRIAVNADETSASSRYSVVFLATEAGTLGLYHMSVDPGVPAVSVPEPVVTVGEFVTGLGVVSDLGIHDAINEQSEIVFWARTTSGIEGVIQASTCTSGASGGTGGEPNPPTCAIRLTYSQRVATKMFIGPIGLSQCDAAAVIDPLPDDTYDARLAAYNAFCLMTDLSFGEDPPTGDDLVDPLDARVTAVVDLFWVCEVGQAFPVDAQVVPVASVGGPEPGGLTGVANPILVRNEIFVNGEWAIVSSGRPAVLGDAVFQAITPRSNVDIWHRVSGTISCGQDLQGLPTSTFTAGFDVATRFPSHRLYISTIDGSLPEFVVDTIDQQALSNLWFLPSVGLP